MVRFHTVFFASESEIVNKTTCAKVSVVGQCGTRVRQIHYYCYAMQILIYSAGLQRAAFSVRLMQLTLFSPSHTHATRPFSHAVKSTHQLKLYNIICETDLVKCQKIVFTTKTEPSVY